MQQFPRYSPAALEFNWWYIAIGVALWGIVIGLYCYFLYGGKKSDEESQRRRSVNFLRVSKRRQVASADARDSALTVVELARAEAEAAADAAEAAADPAAAARAAVAANTAAERAEDAARAVNSATKALMSHRQRENIANRGKKVTTPSDDIAIAARRAADRAVRVAAGKAKVLQG